MLPIVALRCLVCAAGSSAYFDRQLLQRIPCGFAVPTAWPSRLVVASSHSPVNHHAFGSSRRLVAQLASGPDRLLRSKETLR